MANKKLSGLKDSLVNNPSFTLKEQLGYAGGAFGNCMGQDSVQTFSEQFSRDFMGIDSKRMILMGNILTAEGLLSTTISGNFLDAPTRPGKKPMSKIFLGITPLPFALSSMLLFIVPTSVGFVNSCILKRSVTPEEAMASRMLINFIWTIVLRIIFGLVDAFFDSSLNTISLRMTTNPRDRKNFYTLATLAGSLGSMLPGWVIPIVVDRMPDANSEKWAYFYIALVFCVIGVSLMYAPYFTLNEKIRVTEKAKKTVIQWDRQTVGAILHNRPFIVLLIGNFFESIRQMSYSLLNYIYKKTFDDYSMKAVIDAISGTLSYAGLAAVPVLGSRFSARSITSAGFAYTGVFYSVMAMFLIKFDLGRLRKFRYLIGVLIALAGMPNNAIGASKRVIVGDSTDYMEWYSEKRYGTPIHSEGLITATQGITGTLFGFIRTNLYNMLFDRIGYKQNTFSADGQTVEAVQSIDTLRGLYMMFTLCGVFGNFLAAICYRFDNYTGKRREEIYAELLEFRAKRNADTEKAEACAE